jgi:hypothetical protein
MAYTVVVTPNLMAETDLLTPAKVNLAADPAVAVTGNLSAAGDGPTATPTSGQILQWNATTSHWEPATLGVKAIRGQTADLRAWVDESTATTINVRADGVNLEQITGISPAQAYTGNTLTTSAITSMAIDCSTGTGANHLDTGTIAAAKWYYLWIIYNGSTVAGLVSLQNSPGSLALPTGYTYAARVGAFRTRDAAAEFQATFQVGDRVAIKPRNLTAFTASTAMAVLTGTQATEFAAAVPIVARGVTGIIGKTTGGAVNVWVGTAATTGGAPAANLCGGHLIQVPGGLVAADPIGTQFPAFTGGANFEVATPQLGAYERNIAVVAKAADSYVITITGYIVS